MTFPFHYDDEEGEEEEKAEEEEEEEDEEKVQDLHNYGKIFHLPLPIFDKPKVVSRS